MDQATMLAQGTALDKWCIKASSKFDNKEFYFMEPRCTKLIA